MVGLADAHLHARAILLDRERGAGILFAEPVDDRFEHILLDDIRDRHPDVVLARQLGSEPEILASELEREADAFEVAFENNLRQRAQQHPLAIRAVRYRREER